MTESKKRHYVCERFTEPRTGAAGSFFVRIGVLAAVVAIALGLSPLTLATATPSSAHSSHASNKDWSVTLWVARTTTRTGAEIPAQVTITNRTKHVRKGTGCLGVVGSVVIGNAAVPNVPAVATVVCFSQLSPGAHTYPSEVWPNYVACGGKSTHNPPCSKSHKPVPLPRGVYRTELVLPISTMPVPKPLTITVTP